MLNSTQQDEVNESRIKTAMDMGRSTLKYKNFPHELWEEAINTSAYIMN